MKLLLVFALVAVANANISQLFSKFSAPRSNNQGPSNSLSILPALLQLKQSFSGAQGSGQQGFAQQSFAQQGPAPQQQVIKVIHVSAPQQQQQQQYYPAPQQYYQSAPSNQYLPPVQNEPLYQSHPVDQVSINAPSPVYHHQPAQQVQYVQQQPSPVYHQAAPVQNEPVEIEVHVQHVTAPHPAHKPQYVEQPQVQYVQQPAPQVQYVQAPQVQYVQQPAAPQYVQHEPQIFEAPSQGIQAPAASFSDVSGYSYNAPH